VVNGALDFEAAASRAITVRVTDAGGLTVDKTFTHHDRDVSEAAVEIALSNTRRRREHASHGGSALVWLRSRRQRLSYSLVRIRVAVAISGQSVWSTVRSTRGGTAPRHPVRATDTGGLPFDKSFTIAIGNVNERRQRRIVEQSVAENSAVKPIVGALSGLRSDGNASLIRCQHPGSLIRDLREQPGGERGARFRAAASRITTVRATDTAGQPSTSASPSRSATSQRRRPASHFRTQASQENSAIKRLWRFVGLRSGRQCSHLFAVSNPAACSRSRGTKSGGQRARWTSRRLRPAYHGCAQPIPAGSPSQELRHRDRNVTRRDQHRTVERRRRGEQRYPAQSSAPCRLDPRPGAELVAGRHTRLPVCDLGIKSGGERCARLEVASSRDVTCARTDAGAHLRQELHDRDYEREQRRPTSLWFGSNGINESAPWYVFLFPGLRSERSALNFSLQRQSRLVVRDLRRHSGVEWQPDFETAPFAHSRCGRRIRVVSRSKSLHEPIFDYSGEPPTGIGVAPIPASTENSIAARSSVSCPQPIRGVR